VSDVPHFLVIGTPRSGTTLVQRLACELTGVAVPHETHFFSMYASDLLRRRRFPIDGDILMDELRAWSSNRGLGGTPIDVRPMFDRLAGRAGNLWDMFSAIVAELAGDGSIIGEKTPDHLQWWRPLTRHARHLKLIAVVRDPRAVVASLQQVPFGKGSHVLDAEAWRADQRMIRDARDSLDPRRFLLLHYESVVADPQDARARIADMLGTSSDASPPAQAPAGMSLAWEEWKRRASEPVTTSRLDAWRDTLTPRQVTEVEAICREEIERFEYRGASSRWTAIRALAGLGLEANFRRSRFRRARWIRARWLRSDRVRRALSGG
jgi:hypothetical protein